MKSTYYMGQKVLGLTYLFGKNYFWMEDGDGVVYLVKAREVKGQSVSDTGEGTEFVENLVPDFS